MIEPIEKSNGVSRVRLVCDDCARNECLPCDYQRKSSGKWELDEGQAKKKAVGLGWSYVKNKLRCPTCEAKRKVVTMKQEPKTEAPREPTKRQRIEIFTMLAECYDIDAGRYQQGDTDDTVAEVLGVMPGWVAEIREAEFGPDGGNEDIEDLMARIEAFDADTGAIIRAAEQVTTQAQKKLAEVSAMKAELERIKKAVGPRVQRVAGVK